MGQILLKLSEERIFDIKVSEDGAIANFEEGCDEYFDCELNKSEMLGLIQELQEIADKMVDSAPGNMVKILKDDGMTVFPISKDAFPTDSEGSTFTQQENGDWIADNRTKKK